MHEPYGSCFAFLFEVLHEPYDNCLVFFICSIYKAEPDLGHLAYIKDGALCDKTYL